MEAKTEDATPRPAQGGWDTFRKALPRVFSKRCPQCGDGALFARRYSLHRDCSNCGLVYRREQGSMTGSMYLSAAVTEIFAAGVALGLFFLTDLTLTAMLVIGFALVIAFCAWFLPHSKAIWVAVEYATDVGNDEDWVDPR